MISLISSNHPAFRRAFHKTPPIAPSWQRESKWDFVTREDLAALVPFGLSIVAAGFLLFVACPSLVTP